MSRPTEEFKARLRPDLRTLWEAVENCSQRPILVQQAAPGQLKGGEAGVQTDRNQALLLFRDIETPDEMAVVHELLHLQRYWAEGVPQLHSGAEARWVAQVENRLEHQIIVPRQSDYDLRGEAWWNAGIRRSWEEPHEKATALATRRELFMLWLNINLVTDQDIVAFAQSKLERLNLFDQAEAFRIQCGELLSDKPMLAAYVAHNLKMRPADIFLVDAKHGYRTLDIPAWKG